MKNGTKSNTENNTTIELTHQQKYQGLIKRSPLKDFRDNLFRYFDYIYTMSPSYRFLSDIFSTIIFVQQCIMSFFPFDQILWPKDSLFGRIFSVFTVISFICPKSVSSSVHFTIALIIYIILLIFFVLFFINFFIFLKMSKVSSFIESLVTIFFNILQPYFIHLISSNLGRDLFDIIEDNKRILHIVNLIIGLILLVLLLVFQTYFVSPSLTFRPQVIPILYSRYSLLYNCSYIFIFFFTTYGSLANGLTGLVLSFITIIPAIIIIIISFQQFLWADIHSMVISEAFSITFCICAIVLPVLSYNKNEGSEAIILIFVVFILALIIAFTKLAEYQKKKSMDLLNEAEQDETYINNLSYRKVTSILRYGFENGRAICHNWKLFDKALEKYPKDYIIILMYARYAAIYPGESNALHVILRILKIMKKNSIEIKHMLFQIQSLLLHRERGLSKVLKKTLSKISDKIKKCRGLMRYTWECVIRGNVIELESLSSQLKRTEESILREFHQLSLAYPNNPYVTYSFGSYLRDIMRDDKEADAKQKIFLLLRSGAWTRTERSYYFAIRQIKDLPTEDKHSSLVSFDKKLSTTSDSHSFASSTATIGGVGDFDDEEETIKTQRKYIETMVNSVRLPTTRYGPIVIIFAISILLPVIIIPELIVIYMGLLLNEKSLDIIRSSSLINLYMSHVAFHTLQYGLSVNGYTPTLKEKYDTIYGDDKVKDLFQNKTIKFQMDDDQLALLHVVEYLRIVVNNFNNLLPDFVKTGYFDEPLNSIFNNTMYSRNYNETNNYYVNYASLENVITYTEMTAVQIASKNDSSIFDILGFWQVVKNADIFYDQFDRFQLAMDKSFQNMLKGDSKSTQIMVLCSTIPGFVVSILLIISLIVKMEKEKRQLFSCFKALPKSAVSSIVQQLNAQSGKESQENEQQVVTANAQEENALRVLSTSVDKGLGWAGRSKNIIAILIIFSIASIIAIVLMSVIPVMFNNDLVCIVPLYHDIQMIHSLFMNSLLILNRNALANNNEEKNKLFPYEQYPDDYEFLLNVTDQLLDNIPRNSHILRFGSPETGSKGVSFVGDELINILINHDDLDTVIPLTDAVILGFSSYDIGLDFICRMMKVMVINLRSNIHYYYLSHQKLSLATIWLIESSYMDYVIPSFNALDSEAQRRCETNRSFKLLLPIIIITIIIVICGIILTPIFLNIGKIAQWTLKLLLFCDPNVVFQSKVILKILSNDFSQNDKEKNDEDSKANFYESIVSNLLDGVIFMSNDLIIRSANNSVKTVIGKDPNKIIGMSLKKLFVSPNGQEASLRSFYQAVDGMMNCMRSPSIETEVEVMKDNEPVTLLLSMTAISANGEVQIKPINSEGLAILVLSIKDMTSTVAARTLLQEENAKNENLLSMILPPIIVNKLQRGEQNICFSVQSASIVFMDIVSFTPWCGSNTAAYVMSTLNKLFLYFDTALKKLDKMTKIKCIGDCYMCAGGIFDEVNQPEGHARQAITFGLEAIKCVEQIDVELHESLRIRVGCNTGGPIVAGVLGIEKPTFDILGPDINLGAMMEHHGVPMNVHIPQHVYDLGMYKYFVVKERGDVDVKGKMYHTYVVTGYANTNN